MSLLNNNPAISRPDWLPEGLWPELDELRSDHLAILQRRIDATAEYTTTQASFEAEDEARVQAYADGAEPPEMTSQADREAALDEARAKAEGAQRALGTFAERAVAKIQAMELTWFQDLSAQNAAAEAKCEEAARLYAEAERTVGEVRRTTKWVERTAKNQPGLHVSHNALGVVRPKPDAHLSSVLGVPVEA